MRKFFYPESLAVVGVSNRKGNLGRVVLRNLGLFGYKGRVYGVGPERGCVEGIEVFPSVSALPEAVDLACILVPAGMTPRIMRECGERGVTRAAILSGGFAEHGNAGLALQTEIVAIAKHHGVRFIGPNGMGLGCPESGVVLAFSNLAEERAMRNGPMTVLSQSGSVAFLASWIASDEGMGIAKYASMGNKADLDEVDLLPWFIEQDEGTEVICLYLEGVDRGRELVLLAQNSQKPIVVLKSNISKTSEGAARSHTASLANDDRVVDGVFRQAGITRVTTVRDMVFAAKALRLSGMRGNNVGIVASTGGPGVIAADWCSRLGFLLPEFPEAFLENVTQRRQSDIVSARNPLDLAGVSDNDTVLYCVEQVAAFANVDGIVVSLFENTQLDLSGPSTTEVIERIGEISRRTHKPIAVTLMESPSVLRRLKRTSTYPIFDGVEECVRALGISRRHHQRGHGPSALPETPSVDRDGAAKIIARARSNGLSDIGPDAMALVASYGLCTQPLLFASCAVEAARHAQAVGYPVVLKAVARGLSHKSDVGGVMLNLGNRSDVEAAFHRIRASVSARLPQNEFLGVVVQRMVPGGCEFILGAKRDPQFGPVVLVGLGGVLTEVFSDATCRLAPLSRGEAIEMISELDSAIILGGVRGQGPSDMSALADALVRLSWLIADHEEIKEMDVNPIKVFGEGLGATAVDARVVLR